MIAGKVAFRYADREETYEAGDAYYAPPGHTPVLFAGTEMVEFSPTGALGETIAVVVENLRAAGVEVRPMSVAAGMTRGERVTVEACRAYSSAADTGGAIVLGVPEAPDSPMLNRIVGLGAERPATEADIDEALAMMGTGVSFYVAVAPGARPPELPEWLHARGLEPGWGWMAFRRGVQAGMDPDCRPGTASSLRGNGRRPTALCPASVPSRARDRTRARRRPFTHATGRSCPPAPA